MSFAGYTLDESLNLLNVTSPNTKLLIVKFKDHVPVSSFVSQADPCQACAIQPKHTSPVFARGAEVYAFERAQGKSKNAPHLENYMNYGYDHFLSKEEAANTLKAIYADKRVEFAYFEPRIEAPVMNKLMLPKRSVLPQSQTPIATTPDFESKQFYLDEAPNGVEARFAWSQPNGAGQGVKIVDVEVGWNIRHEDFTQPFFIAPNSDIDEDHGTAVWGEIAAKRDGKGMTGIANQAQFGVSIAQWPSDQFWETQVPRALDLAQAQLGPGDVIIIELHGPGPDGGRYMAVEYYQAIFDVVKMATDKGIIVVAAAGNGGSNLDDPSYKGAFDVNVRDSGAIIVGAGGSPKGGQHLERLGFSCYGSRVDAFAYGEDVPTTGYGDLQYVTNATYTSSFSGTSSATPIVTGVSAVISGLAKAKGKNLTSKEVRAALRSTGTVQKGNVGERIGALPNLKQLAETLQLLQN
jgi:subtilisin family serine protease